MSETCVYVNIMQTVASLQSESCVCTKIAYASAVHSHVIWATSNVLIRLEEFIFSHVWEIECLRISRICHVQFACHKRSSEYIYISYTRLLLSYIVDMRLNCWATIISHIVMFGECERAVANMNAERERESTGTSFVHLKIDKWIRCIGL